MKKISIILTIVLFSLFQAQRKSTSEYRDINSRLDKLLEKRNITKKLIEINLDDKSFVLVKNEGVIVYKNIINFLPDHKINIIKNSNNTSNDTNVTKLFSGDYEKRNNYISIRADYIETQKTGFPLTYNFILQERNKVLYLINLNNNEKWIYAKILEK